MTPEQLEKLTVETHYKVSRIEAVLMGDEMGSIGMAQRMVNNEKQINIVKDKIENHEKKCDARNNKVRGVVWFIGVVWTVGVFLFGVYVAMHKA